MTRNWKITIGILVSLILCSVICISYQFGRYVQCKMDTDTILKVQTYYMDQNEG